MSHNFIKGFICFSLGAAAVLISGLTGKRAGNAHLGLRGWR
jgi:hypothetical protein